jgi:flagellum-specific ATP synthase
VSRLDRAVCTESEIEIISQARDLLSIYKQNEDLINVGAYVKNSNPKIDRAIEKIDKVETFLKQRYDQVSTRESSFKQLTEIFSS